MTRVEDLSNELFYEIFPHLDGFDLYEAFAGLNSRFECVLTDQILRMSALSLVPVEPAREERFLVLALHHRSRIISLKVNCLMSLDPSFISLESLTLSQLKSGVLEACLTSLASLPRLLTLTIEQNDNERDLRQIYRLIFQLPVLKHLQVSSNALETFIPMSVPIDDDRSPIEHLLINHPCVFSDLMSLLSYVPRLESLTCREIWQSRPDTVENFSVRLPQLTRLWVHQRDLRFNRLELLLNQLSPMLRVLRVSGGCAGDDYINVHRWERLLTQKFNQLKKFFLDLHIHLDSSSHLKTYHNIMKHFSTPFWIEGSCAFEAKVHWSYRVCYDITYTIVSDRYTKSIFSLHMLPFYD